MLATKNFPNLPLQTSNLPLQTSVLPPDPVIEYYKQFVDRTLLRENLKLTPQERSEKFERAMELVFELRKAAEERRKKRTMQDQSSPSTDQQKAWAMQWKAAAPRLQEVRDQELRRLDSKTLHRPTEHHAFELGIEQGIEESIETILRFRFSGAGLEIMEEIRSVSNITQLRRILEQALTVTTPEELRSLWTN